MLRHSERASPNQSLPLPREEGRSLAVVESKARALSQHTERKLLGNPQVPILAKVHAIGVSPLLKDSLDISARSFANY